MKAASLAFVAIVGLVPAGAWAQGQFPAHEEERILPHLTRVNELPSWLAQAPVDLRSRPLWYLPLGTKFRFKHDRRLLPYTTKYAIGDGPVMGNQYLHLAPSYQERILPRDMEYTLVRLEGVHARASYSPHLLQPRHLVRMVLEAPSGLTVELEICPGSQVTPTVAQFADYVDLSPPPAETLE